MVDPIGPFQKWFWDESIWTPPNATWAQYEELGFRHFNDIYYSAYTAVVLIILRFTMDRYIFAPFGVWLGLQPNRSRPPPKNKALEKVFWQTRGKISDKQLAGLVKQLDCSEREIQRYMRHRLAQIRPTVLSKFTESAWRCFFYCVMFIYGVVILWNKSWMWDSVFCFKDYPYHYVSSEEWWYYNIESAFYLSLLFSQFFDVQRKDFWVMFVHHVVTLCLLTFSWACNLVRIGTLVLIIHDFADIPLEGAKMMAYVKKKQIADITFNIFALCWVVSRIGLLPYRIIYYSSYVALDIVPMFSAYYIFNGLLIALQTLHIIWTYFIIKVAIHAWNNNGIRDIRSDDEEDEAEVLSSSSSSSSINGDEPESTDKKILSNSEKEIVNSSHLPYLNGDATKVSAINGVKLSSS